MQAVAPGLAELEVVAPDSVKQAGASRSQVQEAQAALPEASTFTSAAQVSLSCCSSHNQLWCRIDVRVAGCRAHADMWQCRHVAVQACAEGTYLCRGLVASVQQSADPVELANSSQLC